MENVSIDSDPHSFAQRDIAACPRLWFLARSIFLQEIRIIRIRPSPWKPRGGRRWKGWRFSRSMSNYCTTKYLSENWITRTRRVALNKRGRRFSRAEKRSWRRAYWERGRERWSHLIMHAIYIDMYITVYVEETKPLAENASQRQAVYAETATKWHSCWR